MFYLIKAWGLFLGSFVTRLFYFAKFIWFCIFQWDKNILSLENKSSQLKNLTVNAGIIKMLIFFVGTYYKRDVFWDKGTHQNTEYNYKEKNTFKWHAYEDLIWHEPVLKEIAKWDQWVIIFVFLLCCRRIKKRGAVGKEGGGEFIHTHASS